MKRNSLIKLLSLKQHPQDFSIQSCTQQISFKFTYNPGLIRERIHLNLSVFPNSKNERARILVSTSPHHHIHLHIIPAERQPTPRNHNQMTCQLNVQKPRGQEQADIYIACTSNSPRKYKRNEPGEVAPAGIQPSRTLHVTKTSQPIDFDQNLK